jgi:hypothetical protein
MPAHGGHGWVGPGASDRYKWAARAAPFFLGAAGVLIMDAGMGVQFMLWGDGGPSEGLGSEVLVVEETGTKGAGRWRRVSGWMRGWMPIAAGGSRAKRVVGRDVDEFETDTEAGSGCESESESLLDGHGGHRGYGGV